MLCLWLLLSSALAVPLGDVPVPEGTVVTSHHHTAIDLELQASTALLRRTLPLRKAHDQQSTVHVVRTQGLPTRLQIAWQQNHQRDEGPDGQHAADLPVVGRRYDLRQQGGAWQIDGTPTDAEREINLAASDLFVLLRDLRRMLPDDAAPGTQVPAGPMFGGIVRDAPGDVQVDGTLTLIEERLLDGVPCALWDLRLHLSSSGLLLDMLQANFSADLVGVVAVEVQTGWTRRLEVSGEVALDGTTRRLGQDVVVTGRGPFLSSTRLLFDVGDAVAEEPGG